MEDILSRLQDPDPEIRELTLDKIVELRPNNAFELILPLLADDNEEVRGTAACNLGLIGDSRAIPYLIKLARSDNSEKVRAEALLSLAEYREDKILDCLVDEVHRKKISRRPRQEVARQLRYYNTDKSVRCLMILLQDDDIYVRIPAVDSLYQLNRSELRGTWLKALEDPSHYVREVAATALAQLDET